MKKYYFAFVAVCFLSFANGQIINFPDVRFKLKLLEAHPNLDIAKNLAGDYFKIDANDDGNIQQSEALQVSFLCINNIYIYNLIGIEFFTNINHLDCSDSSLTSLNLSSNGALTFLDCRDNQLSSLNLTNNTLLKDLICDRNQLPILNLNNNIALTRLSCSNNQLTTLNVNNNIVLLYLYCNNNQVSNLDVSSNIELVALSCYNNQLSSLNVNSNVALMDLHCNSNQISSLNVSNNIALRILDCKGNQLTSLNVTNNIGLIDLNCLNNYITSINVSNNDLLRDFSCSSNQLTNLYLGNNSLLQFLNCTYNQLTRLDLSSNMILGTLYCQDNQLTSLIIKNGQEQYINFSNNPNLNYICADDIEINSIQSKINSYGYSSTCQVNSYCSFNPGGTFFSIQGSNKFDFNNNGCDLLDFSFPNINFNLTNGIDNGTLLSNNTGNYSIPVQAGTHTITPILENPTYFNVSPTSATITFPATASPAIRDFCITANGVHNDLEISLLPIDAARPGFDASYKLVYKNKGNQTQSGAVGLTFNNAVLDFVTTNPATTSQIVNNLSWSFVDLKPFESREIAVTLNANSPMETPALNGGSILSFTANITATNDESPNDNIAILNQTVVNSFDPNDKTCLEGNNIVPAKVGDYVHYMIRFENTGTFAAQNIVVKDMIDLAKFDIASLIPVKGSHDFYTRINGNKVEFIFENINLPFADATNDGYVAIKIKTKSTLVLGNTFSNSANIYFDYNFPIVTNTATTTVANQLATQDFEFSKYFSIYPNPAKNILNLETKSGATISSLSIYNSLGQLVQVITSPNKTIDVSELKSGNYFIKTVSDKGTSNSKFLKE